MGILGSETPGLVQPNSLSTAASGCGDSAFVCVWHNRVSVVDCGDAVADWLSSVIHVDNVRLVRHEWSDIASGLFLLHLYLVNIVMPSVLWCCWLGDRKSIQPVKMLEGDEVLAWFSVWSEVQMTCIWFGWYHCHPVIFASEKSKMVYPSDTGSSESSLTIWQRAFKRLY